VARQLDDGRLRALAGLGRAYVLQWQDRILEAMVDVGRRRGPCDAAQTCGEARALYMIGWYLIQLGDHQEAAHFSSRASMAYRESLCAA